MESHLKPSMSERHFQLPEDRGIVVFSNEVLQHMYRYTQTSIWQREAGGQLFSRTPEQPWVRISSATGPYWQDRRTRCSFHPDVHKATEDRFQNFAKGLHAVGLWHTHPEAWPTPSDCDRITTQDYLRAFQGDMEGFLLAILGNQSNSPNLTVWMAWQNQNMPWLKLSEIAPVVRGV
jgi:integrative and conjugative element protein (TIGR02256 family)